MGVREALAPRDTVRAVDDDRVALLGRAVRGGRAFPEASISFASPPARSPAWSKLTADRRLGHTLDGGTFAVTKEGLWSLTYDDQAARACCRTALADV